MHTCVSGYVYCVSGYVYILYFLVFLFSKNTLTLAHTLLLILPTGTLVLMGMSCGALLREVEL